MTTYSAVIVAGGVGARMKGRVPKQFLPLSGTPILVHTLRRFLQFDSELVIAVVLNPSFLSLWEETAAEFLNESERARIHTCTGGQYRTNSVANGLELLRSVVADPAQTLVAIHDAVRPFVTDEMIRQAYAMARDKGAAICCVPVKSSIRRKREDGGTQAVDRSQFYHVQTPQVFVLDKLSESYRNRTHDEFTDDATLFESMGGTIYICEGSYDNLKLTTPEDLLIAEMIMKRGLQ